MTGSAYRELERILERSLKAFSKTKQKLNRFERGRRDRVAAILDEVASRREQREQAEEALVSTLAR
jgi:hypothetical protein